MAERNTETEALGAEIVVAIPEGPDKAARLREALDTPFPIWAAETGTPHGVYGLGRAWLGLIQRSGTVVIDPAGTVRYLHVATDPRQSLELDTLLDQLKLHAGGER